METSTKQEEVRVKLEGILNVYKPYAGFDTSIEVRGLGRVAVSADHGETVSFHGKPGTMVIHRCPRGDISIATSHGLGNLEGISRQCGRLQGIDQIPKEVNQLIDALHKRSGN